MMPRALLIEDNVELTAMLSSEMELLGYHLECAPDGAAGLLRALEGEFQFVILDLNLPKLGGAEVCKKLRQHNPAVPIIILTSQSDETHKVLLLELGADDYVCKPFSMPELRARINAVLRRSAARAIPAGAEEAPKRFGELMIDFVRHRITLRGEPVDFTATEFEILAMLAAAPGKPFHREQIIEQLYGDALSLNDKNISNHINRIRTKIEPNPEEPLYVMTLRGVGYYFNDALPQG